MKRAAVLIGSLVLLLLGTSPAGAVDPGEVALGARTHCPYFYFHSNPGNKAELLDPAHGEHCFELPTPDVFMLAKNVPGGGCAVSTLVQEAIPKGLDDYVIVVFSNVGAGTQTFRPPGRQSMPIFSGLETYTAPAGSVVFGLAGGASGSPCTPAMTTKNWLYAQAWGMSDKYLVSGTVTSETRSGAPVDNMPVEARCPSGETRATNKSGQYAFLLDRGPCTIAPVVAQDETSLPSKRVLDVTHDFTGVDFRIKEPLEIDWEMPPRLSQAELTAAAARGAWGLPNKAYVDPPKWRVRLFLTHGGKPVCPPHQYAWTISSDGATQTQRGGCSVTVDVPELGTYAVTAAEIDDGSPTGVVAENDNVIVRDWLIVGLGDSNGSGEGNPPFFFHQCDRSFASYQYQVAEYIENHDRHSSVTFLFASCSGARTEHLWEFDYIGINPKDGPELPPQLTQVANVMGNRTVNAAIMSIGINNIYFSSMILTCIKDELPNLSPTPAQPPPPPCESEHVDVQTDSSNNVTYSPDTKAPQTLAQATTAALGQLPGAYSTLGSHLQQTIRPRNTFITTYPDNATDEHSNLCTDGKGPPPWFEDTTWSWLEDTGNQLNLAVAKTSSLGWAPVTGIAQGFVGHGYCSSDSYFVPLHGSFVNQHDQNGSYHATLAGQKITAAATQARVCEALYGNSSCDGTPPF
jgi:hypothetical protein